MAEWVARKKMESRYSPGMTRMEGQKCPRVSRVLGPKSLWADTNGEQRGASDQSIDLKQLNS